MIAHWIDLRCATSLKRRNLDIEFSAIGIAGKDASLKALSNPNDVSNTYGDEAGATTPATPL